MELRPWLAIAFRYDLWANSKWIDHLGGFRKPEHATRVMEHIVQAQRIWLLRCGQEVAEVQESESLVDLAKRINLAWSHLVESAALDTRIDYRNLAGEPMQSQLAEIALHVVNHGTYHRGHLRGLADAEGFEAFDDTDLIKYFRLEEPLPVS